MTSIILHKAKYGFECQSCGKFRQKGSFYYKFTSVTGTRRYYCEKCANNRFKHYKCQECGKKWTVFKEQEIGWDNDSFIWIDDEKRIWKYGDKWLCYECFIKRYEESIRKDSALFMRICERNKPPENYRFYKLLSITNCKYYFNCHLAVSYGYCKEICCVECERCNKEIKITKCHVHHKRWLPKKSKEYTYERPENLIILCVSCHKKEEKENPPQYTCEKTVISEI